MPKSKRKYVPSQSIRRQITQWEGSSMKTNNSFESEATMFQNYLERAGIFDQMSQDELDGLFSYSYNVGSGNFAKRTLPHLIKLYNGNGTLENVLKNIYGKRDSEPGQPGLRARRKYERNLFAKGYRNRISKQKPAKVAENITTTTPEVNSQPQITLDITGQQQPLTADYPRRPTTQDQTQVENNNIRYPIRKRSIENQLQEYYNGGRLIKKGQYGMPIYNKDLYLEKDPISENDQNLKKYVWDFNPFTPLIHTVFISKKINYSK